MIQLFPMNHSFLNGEDCNLQFTHFFFLNQIKSAQSVHYISISLKLPSFETSLLFYLKTCPSNPLRNWHLYYQGLRKYSISLGSFGLVGPKSYYKDSLVIAFLYYERPSSMSEIAKHTCLHLYACVPLSLSLRRHSQI